MTLLTILGMMISALVKPKQRIAIPSLPKGCILDIGGGGEGVLAQAAGLNDIAIDKYKSEILEARENTPAASWMVADATHLPFKSNSIRNATAFFSCMYMPDITKQNVFEETCRILKSDGEFWIWDAPMASENEVFGIRLKVKLEDKTIRTMYGVKAKDQTADSLCQSLNQAGFDTNVITDQKHWFFIRANRV